ncbi:2932_t:CDS:1, partial [Entrophospora sp. SA101]
MKYVMVYIGNYFTFDGKRYDELFDNERLFDTLSIIKQNETPAQWAIRVRVPLQNLLNAGKFSVYHRFALFASFGQGKFVNFDYYRPKIHKSHMAICFGCWKLVKIDDVNPKKSFHYSRQRYVDYLKPSELMISHWDNECDKPKTDFGKARIIQRAWRNYKNRPESLATQVWNALKTDDYPNDKKFLGITPQK